VKDDVSDSGTDNDCDRLFDECWRAQYDVDALFGGRSPFVDELEPQPSQTSSGSQALAANDAAAQPGPIVSEGAVPSQPSPPRAEPSGVGDPPMDPGTPPPAIGAEAIDFAESEPPPCSIVADGAHAIVPKHEDMPVVVKRDGDCPATECPLLPLPPEPSVAASTHHSGHSGSVASDEDEDSLSSDLEEIIKTSDDLATWLSGVPVDVAPAGMSHASVTHDPEHGFSGSVEDAHESVSSPVLEWGHGRPPESGPAEDVPVTQTSASSSLRWGGAPAVRADDDPMTQDDQNVDDGPKTQDSGSTLAWGFRPPGRCSRSFAAHAGVAGDSSGGGGLSNSAAT